MGYNNVKSELTNLQLDTLELTAKLRDFYKKHGITKIYNDSLGEEVSVDITNLPDLINKLDETVTSNITIPVDVGTTLGIGNQFQGIMQYISNYAEGINMELDFINYNSQYFVDICEIVNSLRNICSLKVINIPVYNTIQDIANRLNYSSVLTELSLRNFTFQQYIWGGCSLQYITKLTIGYTLDYPPTSKPTFSIDTNGFITNCPYLVDLNLPNWGGVQLANMGSNQNMFIGLPNLSEDSIINILTWIADMNYFISSNRDIAVFTGFDNTQMDLVRYSLNPKMKYITNKLYELGWNI